MGSDETKRARPRSRSRERPNKSTAVAAAPVSSQQTGPAGHDRRSGGPRPSREWDKGKPEPPAGGRDRERERDRSGRGQHEKTLTDPESGSGRLIDRKQLDNSRDRDRDRRGPPGSSSSREVYKGREVRGGQGSTARASDRGPVVPSTDSRDRRGPGGPPSNSRDQPDSSKQMDRDRRVPQDKPSEHRPDATRAPGGAPHASAPQRPGDREQRMHRPTPRLGNEGNREPYYNRPSGAGGIRGGDDAVRTGGRSGGRFSGAEGLRQRPEVADRWEMDPGPGPTATAAAGSGATQQSGPSWQGGRELLRRSGEGLMPGPRGGFDPRLGQGSGPRPGASKSWGPDLGTAGGGGGGSYRGAFGGPSVYEARPPRTKSPPGKWSHDLFDADKEPIPVEEEGEELEEHPLLEQTPEPEPMM